MAGEQQRLANDGTDTDDPRITVGESDGDGEAFALPVEEVLQGRSFLTGKSGSGKSNSVSVVVEELLAGGYPVLIFDADGEYISLKEEYDVLHVGADEYCETVVGPDHAGALAELGIVERVPIIVDLSGYVEEEIDPLVAAVTKAFFNVASREKKEGRGKPFLLVVEEMHEYVPQQGGLSEAGQRLIRVAKRGRSRGLGVMGVSQRPAAVDKDFITQCDLLVWHRLSWKNDTRVAKEVIGKGSDELEALADGEAFVVADWFDGVRRIQFRRKRTADLGGAPGLDGGDDVDLREMDTSVLEELDEAAEAARSKEQRIERLEDELEQAREERDEWREKYEDAQYLAEISADVQAAMGGQSAAATVDTVTVEMDGAEFSVPETLQAKVLEVKQDRREAEDRVDALREELADAEDTVAEQQARIEELERYEDRVAELEAVDDLLADLREVVNDRHPEFFAREATVNADGDTAADSADAEATASTPASGEQHPRSAASRDAGASADDASGGAVREAFTEPVTAKEFVTHDLTRSAIDDVVQDVSYSGETVRGAVVYVLKNPGATNSDLATGLNLSAGTVRAIMPKLADVGVVRVEKDGQQNQYHLNTGGLQEVLERRKEREALDAAAREVFAE